MATPDETSTDHDILIELRATTSQNFRYVREDIQRLAEGTHAQLIDHEKRLRSIETGYVANDVYSPAHQALIKTIDSMKRIIYMAMGGWVLFTVLAASALKFIGKN